MIRMSRVGRKALMLKAINAHCKKYRGGFLPTPKVAHRAGLVSSTEVRKMLREMQDDGLIKSAQIEPYYGCEYTVEGWTLAIYEQVPLPERYIKINGVNWLLSAEKEI
jgi:Mn-dependent DtxR family transcriptional regulator